METQFKISNDASLCTIDIEGIIGLPEGEQFADSTPSIATYERFREKVEKIREIKADEVIVNIRSTGGDVNDALLIYEALVALDAKITTRCYGYTASAATIIAQAASNGCREIASSALYLIHLSSSAIEGNTSDLTERIELLKKTDDRISSLYALRSGREKAVFDILMAQNGGRGRWLSPEEVIEAGLADTIIGGEEASKHQGLFAKVKEWLMPTNKCQMGDLPSSEVNILHLPENLLGSTSCIALEEGQKSAQKSKTAEREDPLLEGATLSSNALAYAEDMHNLKFRL